MDEEDKEIEIYDEEAREDLEENDEIDELEEGFMEGYENDSAAECTSCKKILQEESIEEEMDGELYRFCSEKCASLFEKKHQK